MSNSKFCKKYIPNKKIINQLNDFIAINCDIFDLDKMKQFSNEITESIFKKGKYPNIDELNDQIINNIDSMNNVCEVLSKYVNDKNKFSNKESDLKMQLKNNKIEGYYISLTKRRAEILQENIKDMDKIKINDTLTIDEACRHAAVSWR